MNAIVYFLKTTMIQHTTYLEKLLGTCYKHKPKLTINQLDPQKRNIDNGLTLTFEKCSEE